MRYALKEGKKRRDKGNALITDSLEKFKVTTNLSDAPKVAMTFDEASLVHLMSVMTDLYSDPMMAMLREYSTNALDAHIQAGLNRPIEVYTPSTFSQFLKIKDFGIGLSLEDIYEIYSKYGASTKRESNEVVGMLGLGCKSALTYCNQFTLVSVKDGWKIETIVARDETVAGSIQIVSQTQSDEPNGTEIVIPTKVTDAGEIQKKAESFFQYWPKGSVLVNGNDPKHFEGLELIENMWIVPSSNRNNRYSSNNSNCTIVMGNVPYPATVKHELTYEYELVVFVPIGAVHFTPSRESLQMTKKTTAAARRTITTKSPVKTSLLYRVEVGICCYSIYDTTQHAYPAHV